MDFPQPLVLEGTDLPDFIQYVLDKHSEPSTLMVCSSKQAFLDHLQTAPSTERDEAAETQAGHGTDARKEWSVPTLRLLASSHTVRVVFCPDITQVRAYLATFKRNDSETRSIWKYNRSSKPTRLLGILNLVNIHRPTSAFSAQGINRTLATAVEAAYRTGSQLLLAECLVEDSNVRSEDLPVLEDEPPARTLATPTAWDEEVSILNVTTKTFGAGERGWVGRTVKIRRIAARWFVFQKMDTAER